MSSNKTIAGLNSGSVPCSDSSDSILLLWRSPESSLRRKLRSISSRSESCPGDRELLPRFGQLFSLPELFGRLQNADGIRPRGFAPEPFSLETTNDEVAKLQIFIR